MKKCYLFLTALFALLSLTPMKAADVITALSEPIRDFTELKEGDQLVLFCHGTTDASNAEYHTRYAYLQEGDNNMLYINRNLQLGKTSSSDYIWTVIECEQVDGAANIKLQSPRGNYFPNFPYDESSQWNKWPGRSGDEPGVITVTATEFGDSLFFFMDENGVYFNGQNCSSNGIANFVGWNTAGGNSLYMIYRATVESRDTYEVMLHLMDQEEQYIDLGSTENPLTYTCVTGDSISLPSITHYSFVNALNNDFEPVEFPIHVEESDIEVMVYYEKWPLVTVVCYDQNGNQIEGKTFEQWYEKGSKFVAPTAAQMGMGWTLVTTDYDDYTVNEDQLIELTYAWNPTVGLPFQPTTVTDGAFAEGTKFYALKIRDTGYIYPQDDAPELKITNTFDASGADRYLWAITGDLDHGFQLFNKAKGASMQAYTVGTGNATPIQLGDAAAIAEAGEEAVTTFNLVSNGTGFSLAASTDGNACMNRFGGATGEDLKYWNSSASPGDVGSRITFVEFTDEQIENMLFADVLNVLKSEGCVGGYTAEQLAGVRAAYNAKDITTAQDAVAALEGEETIAFDPAKSYYIISAYRGFCVSQPEATYAIYASATDSLKWGALEEGNDAYKWTFYNNQPEVIGDTVYYVNNVAQSKSIASFRFGQKACLYNIDNVKETTDASIVYAEGVKAPFEFRASTAVPNATRLVHNYGASIVTLSAYQGAMAGTATSGLITTYNTDDVSYPTAWRLKVAGDVTTAIDGISADKANDGRIYDITGRQVKNVGKGLYIINGKKGVR